MNCRDYYTRQSGGALPYFAGARFQRGHGLGSVLGGMLRSAMPIIKRGAVALGRGALKTVSTTSFPDSANKGSHTTRHGCWEAFDEWLLTPPDVPPGKRIKRVPAKKRVTSATRQRKRQTQHKKHREADIFHDDDGVLA